ncbi:MAG TPA: JAB domain-containing protein [Longimicrobiaceae bacterium]|jgi:DNA repair protein RadC|nr:JAB domain-containing protein [Longimicrobiaceae bacterium]
MTLPLEPAVGSIDADAADAAQKALHRHRRRHGETTPGGRILTHDPGDLALHELLSILLEPGLGRARADAAAIQLMCGLPAVDGRGPLRRMGRATASEICATAGITPVATARILAALEFARRFATEPALAPGTRIVDSDSIFRRVHSRMRDLDRTEYWTLVLNHQNEIVREFVVSRGLRSAALVHAREVFRPALREHAPRVVLVHNDPDARGVPTPSAFDRMTTHQLSRGAETLDLMLMDHVIVGDAGYFSFAKAGMLVAPQQAAMPDDADLLPFGRSTGRSRRAGGAGVAGAPDALAA